MTHSFIWKLTPLYLYPFSCFVFLFNINVFLYFSFIFMIAFVSNSTITLYIKIFFYHSGIKQLFQWIWSLWTTIALHIERSKSPKQGQFVIMSWSPSVSKYMRFHPCLRLATFLNLGVFWIFFSFLNSIFIFIFKLFSWILMKVLNAADGCKEKKQAHYQVAEA